MREFFVAGINYNDTAAQSGHVMFKFAIGYMLSPDRANNPFGIPLCIRAPETYKTNTGRCIIRSSFAYTCESAVVVSGMVNNSVTGRAETEG